VTEEATRYVVCLRNEGFETSLLKRRLYLVVPDGQAESEALIRVVDETGEDYLYPKENFAPVDVAKETAAALSAA